jgi:hypothetical protein
MKTCNKYLLSTIAIVASLAGSSIARAEEAKLDYKFNALLQNWFYNDTTASAAGPTTGGNNGNPQTASQGVVNFRIRRAELRFSGNVTENARWFVMGDLAKAVGSSTSGNTSTGVVTGTDYKILQDVGAGFKMAPGVEFVIGQFKILTAAEGLAKSSELLFPERSIVGRYYGDSRETGAMMTYQHDEFQIGGMLSTDTGINQYDNNPRKDFSLRADFATADMFKFGAFVKMADLAFAYDSSVGANINLQNGDFRLGVEGAFGSKSTDAGSTNTIKKNAGLLAYAGIMMGDWQPVARFATLNTFKNATDLGQPDQSSSQQFGLGINYYMAKNNIKIQAAYDAMTNLNGDHGTPSWTAPTIGKGGLITLNFQAAI